MFTLAFLLVLIAAGLAASGWVGYLRWKDKAQPEPLWLMVATAGGGAMAVALAAAGYDQLERWGMEILWSSLEGAWPGAIGAALAIGAIEEVAKALPVVALALWSRHFDEWLDGAVYAGCAGIGFAMAETLLHGAGGFTMLELWPRILAAPITHALFAAPFGLGIAAAVFGRRPLIALAGAAGSIAAHGAYDLALARPGLPGFVAAGLVLVLWIAFIVAVPRFASRPAMVRSAVHAEDPG